MIWTSRDRWSCPVCHVTEVPDVPEAQLAAAIREVQEIHAKDHPAPFQPVTGQSLAVARRRRARSRA